MEALVIAWRQECANLEAKALECDAKRRVLMSKLFGQLTQIEREQWVVYHGQAVAYRAVRDRLIEVIQQVTAVMAKRTSS